MVTEKEKARLEVRQASLADVEGIVDLVRRSYEDLPAYSASEVRGQINNFGEGCFVAVLDDKTVGYCASMRISGAIAPTTGRAISGCVIAARPGPSRTSASW